MSVYNNNTKSKGFGWGWKFLFFPIIFGLKCSNWIFMFMWIQIANKIYIKKMCCFENSVYENVKNPLFSWTISTIYYSVYLISVFGIFLDFGNAFQTGYLVWEARLKNHFVERKLQGYTYTKFSFQILTIISFA